MGPRCTAAVRAAAAVVAAPSSRCSLLLPARGAFRYYTALQAGTKGFSPTGELTLDAAGNLYGTTSAGGNSSYCDPGKGCGTIFELVRGAGVWTEKVLHTFEGTDGCYPGALTFDKAGNLYGSTWCGANGTGEVFELTPGANGGWTFNVLYSFKGYNSKDATGSHGVTFDTAGNLYGLGGGGDTGWGTVYQLTPGSSGSWTEKELYSFKGPNGNDGAYPVGQVILDTAGNLYGTTSNGGNYAACQGHGCGTVFELTPGSNGQWTETVLHRFKDNGKDGVAPYAGLAIGKTGYLYGTTIEGGSGVNCPGSCGTVFKLAPGANGTWTETIIHNFTNNGKDGYVPWDRLILDTRGNLYGTTQFGGTHDYWGTIFKMYP